jgi:hypothetical protein
MRPASLASGLWPQLAPTARRARDHPGGDHAHLVRRLHRGYFKEPMSLTQSAGFALIALGAALVFRGQA